MSTRLRSNGLGRGMVLVIGVLLLVSCTTRFPLSLIDGGVGPDADPVDSTAEAGTPDTGSPDTGQPDVQTSDCGNSTLDTGETCDDGNRDPDDGCDAACQQENGWTCTGTPSSCVTTCGDSVTVGTEQCDDGNTVSGDGCNDNCEVECSNGSTADCNPAGETLSAAAAFVDLSPPAGFVQCAGFENTSVNDVGPNWDANCLGVSQTLRIRYWSTSSNPWTLLGDATLAPVSDATYVEQVFNATNHGGTQGVRGSQGVSLLKDDPALTPVTTWVCNPGHPVQEYAASDLYFGTETDNDTVMVCSWSMGDDGASPCENADEIMMAAAGFGVCANGGHTRDLAVALYLQP